jgi:hypothetical protein
VIVEVNDPRAVERRLDDAEQALYLTPCLSLSLPSALTVVRLCDQLPTYNPVSRNLSNYRPSLVRIRITRVYTNLPCFACQRLPFSTLVLIDTQLLDSSGISWNI